MKKTILTVANFKDCILKNNVPEHSVIAFEIKGDIHVITSATLMSNAEPGDELLVLSGEKVLIQNLKNI